MINPTVSVVIPCYNTGKLLSAMLDCLLRQTFAGWECIVVDDGSTDNTPDIVRECAKKDERIKFRNRNREPKGSATCRNIGFDNAIGKYVIHFDADDLISDTCLEKRVQFMEANQEIDYASFPGQSFTNEQNLPIYVEKAKMYGIEKGNKDLLYYFLKADYPFSVWNNIYRKDSISNLSWDEKVKIYTDFSFIIPCILVGLKHKFSGFKEIDYYYKQGGNVGNMCSIFVNDEKCNSTIYLFSKTLDALKARSDYKKRKKEFIQFIVLHFERIIVDGNHIKTKEYLNFCQNYYPKSFTNKLKIINKLALFFKNIVMRKLILYFLTGTLFFRKQSILMFGSTLLHWR